jgi:hypothetical protein
VDRDTFLDFFGIQLKGHRLNYAPLYQRRCPKF